MENKPKIEIDAAGKIKSITFNNNGNGYTSKPAPTGNPYFDQKVLGYTEAEINEYIKANSITNKAQYNGK